MDARSAPKIGRTIKRARERRRLSQAEAAAALGVSRSALNAWENDRAYPRSSIGAIEELYGIVIDSEPEQQEPEIPTPAELEDLRVHIREVMGGKANAVEAALDAALHGEPRG
jgi:transcriptional regulator with XRE-family HTH domain